MVIIFDDLKQICKYKMEVFLDNKMTDCCFKEHGRPNKCSEQKCSLQAKFFDDLDKYYKEEGE